MGFMSLLSFQLNAITRRTSVNQTATKPSGVPVNTPSQAAQVCSEAVPSQQNRPAGSNTLFAGKRTELFNECGLPKPAPLVGRPACTRSVKTNQRAGTHSYTRTGRLVLSGRMADVCAELDRLIALEHGLLHKGMH